MRVLLALENSLSRDFVQNHLLQSHRTPADRDLSILTAASLAEAIVLANEMSDLALAVLDLQIPDMQGLHGLKRFRRDCRHRIPLAVMDARSSKVSVADLTAAGVAGFLSYNLAPDAFLGAIRLLIAGERYFPVDMITSAPPLAIHLTRREHDVLKGLRDGLGNRDIASSLALSEVTVKHHIKSLRGKLGARNRLHAVCRANELQIR
ncbi:LuxR C-terminal-related transcriptional regulator [Alphaproteobacteria bacterium LSUCC0719]